MAVTLLLTIVILCKTNTPQNHKTFNKEYYQKIFRCVYDAIPRKKKTRNDGVKNEKYITTMPQFIRLL